MGTSEATSHRTENILMRLLWQAEFNNMAWAIFSKWNYVATWLDISTQQNQSPDAIYQISIGQTFKVTFSKYASMTLLIPENDLI